MQFIKGKPGIDIEDTPVENIFIDAFMPSAEGNFVKVYLLGYKYACSPGHSSVFSNETISRALDIPISTVLKAWDYWEQRGIIKKHCTRDGKSNFSVEFLSLKQLYIDNYRSVPGNSPEEAGRAYTPSDLMQAMGDTRIRDMFNKIQKIICRPLTPSESLQCLEWLYDLKMVPEIIEEAFRYSVEKRGVKNIRYINTIINNWYDNNINTLEKLSEHLEVTDARYTRYNRVMRALGRPKNPTKIEKQYMDKWLDEYSMPVEVILKACDTAVIQTPSPSLNYVDGIIIKWYKDGVKTLADIPAGKKEPKPQRRKSAKGKFHSFEQSALKLTNEQLKEILNKHKDA
ncbi:MAG: DnaD domain protein [Bacillota bacterium]|nr:DnaD domain protein [Bacillota bacterium]MDD3297997.1 DnaD domain protein [Bacillota bacterium]MDD3850028.1 DnaD domain protein [Bacillota bacterium]MDD4706735.1 DnaD domain protein [Bacillota bacterium]